MLDTDTYDIYWAVVRNQNKRHSYLEVAQHSGNRWSVVIDDKEFIVRSTSTDFLVVLHEALTKYLADAQSPTEDTA